MYDGAGRTLADVVDMEQPNIEDAVHLRISLWKAFKRLPKNDADVISLLMIGYGYKDISPMIHNARYRIRIAKKRFQKELDREGINV